MYHAWVDGQRVPKPIGGHVALDFCNTYAGWDRPAVPAGEWLKTYDVLAVWASYAGLYDAETATRLSRKAHREPTAAADALSSARAFRTQLHDALVDPGDTRALAGVSVMLRRAGELGSLVPTSDGPRWAPGRGAGLLLPLLHVVHAAEGLLTSDRLDDVRTCPGHECGWLFLDPRRRRRWCSMSACGNRAKVAAYAARRRG